LDEDKIFCLSCGQAIPKDARFCNYCGASVRSLCLAFRAHYNCSPMDFVRQVRLDAARAALQSAAPGAQVTDIALACGFGHLGRFAAVYRECYGESPQQTLRR
jgi:transcriptional regulator GlxA family with amidase domain